MDFEWDEEKPGSNLHKHGVGMLKKAASGVPCLRRSGYAQAGRLFAVLTYRVYAPRVKRAAALLDGLF